MAIGELTGSKTPERIGDHIMRTLLRKVGGEPRDESERCASWWIKMTIWAQITSVMVFLSIALPALATVASDDYKKYLTVAATILAGYLSWLRPAERKDQFNASWILLSQALKTGDQEKIDEAVARGECIINSESMQKYAPDVYIGPPTKTSL